MKPLFRALFISSSLCISSLAMADIAPKNTTATHNYFQFQIQQYHTQRQTGQTLNVYVKYALKPGLDASQYPDYVPMRQVVLNYLEPTEELPANVFWEIIAQKIGDELYNKFPVEGVSVQMMVFPSEPDHMYEPGFHGPIYTKGNIPALEVAPPAITQLPNQ